MSSCTRRLGNHRCRRSCKYTLELLGGIEASAEWNKGGVGRNSKWGHDLPILMYVYACFWSVKREIAVGYLLDMCLYLLCTLYCVGRCCVVEERFESGEMAWVLFTETSGHVTGV